MNHYVKNGQRYFSKERRFTPSSARPYNSYPAKIEKLKKLAEEYMETQDGLGFEINLHHFIEWMDRKKKDDFSYILGLK